MLGQIKKKLGVLQRPLILKGLKLFLGVVAFVLFTLGTVFFSHVTADLDCPGVTKWQGYRFYFQFPFVNTLKFPSATAVLCSNVFFEGVYEASEMDPQGPTKISEICEYINSKTPFKAWSQCIFNLGIAIGYDKRDTISSPEVLQKFIDAKISFCESLPKDGLDCVSGLYTGVNIAYQDESGRNKYPTKPNDPFWMCKVGRGVDYQVNCLRNMVSYLYMFTGGDLEEAVAIIQNFPVDEEMHFEINLTFFSSLAFVHSLTNKDIHAICRAIKDVGTRYACIEGYATGLDEVLDSGTEALGVTNYCLESPYTFDEKGQCLRRGFFELPVSNDFTIKEAACLESVPKVYAPFCKNFDAFLDYSPFKQKSRSFWYGSDLHQELAFLNTSSPLKGI